MKYRFLQWQVYMVYNVYNFLEIHVFLKPDFDNKSVKCEANRSFKSHF